MLEEHEEDIEEWFFHYQANDKNDGTSGSSLENFLCRQGRVLKTKADQKCLDKILEDKSKKRKSKKIKGEVRDAITEDDISHTEL